MCRAVKTQRAPCKTKTERKPDDLPEPKAFADRISLDFKILNEDENESREKLLLVVQDAFTKWIQAYACKSRKAEEVKLLIKRFLGPGKQCQHAYSDNAEDFKLFADLEILHATGIHTDQLPVD